MVVDTLITFDNEITADGKRRSWKCKAFNLVFQSKASELQVATSSPPPTHKDRIIST